MAKALYPMCETVEIKKILLAWDTNEEGITQAYAVVMGSSLDSEGNAIPGQDIHEKVYLGPALPWSPANIKDQLKALLIQAYKAMKQAYKKQADVDIVI
jgi:hypothetical protein